jgi:small subunit ribosomal protein S16
MLSIRFKRVGRKNQPSYRVIVTPKRAGGPKGRPVEYLGWFNPFSKNFALKKERVLYWLSQGAKPSNTLHNLLVKAGVVKEKKIPVHKKSKKTESPILSVKASAQTEALAKEDLSSDQSIKVPIRAGALAEDETAGAEEELRQETRAVADEQEEKDQVQEQLAKPESKKVGDREGQETV